MYAGSQSYSTRALASTIDSSGCSVFGILEELRFGSSGIAQKKNVAIPSDSMLDESNSIHSNTHEHGTDCTNAETRLHAHPWQVGDQELGCWALKIEWFDFKGVGSGLSLVVVFDSHLGFRHGWSMVAGVYCQKGQTKCPVANERGIRDIPIRRREGSESTVLMTNGSIGNGSE